VEDLRQHVCKRIKLRRQLLKTDPAFQANTEVWVSIDKIKYTHANILFKWTVQGKTRAKIDRIFTGQLL
jgi:hypothetical protein